MRTAGSARSHFRTKLVCNRYFPDPPGIGGLPPNFFTIHSSLFTIP